MANSSVPLPGAVPGTVPGLAPGRVVEERAAEEGAADCAALALARTAARASLRALMRAARFSAGVRTVAGWVEGLVVCGIDSVAGAAADGSGDSEGCVEVGGKLSDSTWVVCVVRHAK